MRKRELPMAPLIIFLNCVSESYTFWNKAFQLFNYEYLVICSQYLRPECSRQHREWLKLEYQRGANCKSTKTTTIRWWQCGEWTFARNLSFLRRKIVRRRATNKRPMRSCNTTKHRVWLPVRMQKSNEISG